MKRRTHHSLALLVRDLVFVTLAGMFLAVGTVVALSPAEPPPDVDMAAALEPDVALQSEAPVAAAPAAAPEEPAPPPLDVTHGEIRAGDSLAASMAREGIPPEIVNRLSRQMTITFDFRRQARPGHHWRLARDADGSIVDFRYTTSDTVSHHLFYDADDRLVVRKEEAELVPRVARIAGVVTTSLYDAIRSLGEDPQLARDFADIFAWDMDFTHAVQPGDEFRILYERLNLTEEDGTETYVRPGLILAARYSGAAGDHTAVYFEAEPGRGGYYRPDGTSVQGAFLQAPVRHARVTSRYAAARLHPILKITRPHHGIDFAAPLGEPVWSVADGKVIYRDRAGGFGNLVKVRHANGYVSYYAHLSRFAKGLKVGDSVRQKQVIGYVGSTGLSTGPHVCFRIAKDGRYVNPATLKLPSSETVASAVGTVFESTRDTFLSELEAGPVVATGEAL